MMQLSQALEGFRQYDQFIIYKLVPRGNGKTDKLPMDPRTGEVKNAHDPSIWMDADNALEAMVGLNAHGIGFVFTENDPWFFVDVDDCIDPSGNYSEVATNLINMLPGAAVELSSSNKGIHIFGYGTPPEHACKNTSLGIELYHKDRFVAFGNLETMVGNAYLDFTDHLVAVVNTYFPPKEVHDTTEWTTSPVAEWLGPDDDDELIKRALKSANRSAANTFGGKANFADLWNSNVEALAASYPTDTDGKSYDGSSADAALAQHLMFWTGKDCERTERLMWQSGLVREKWDRHKNYLRMTIIAAKTNQKDVYKTRDVALQPMPEPQTDGTMIGQGWTYFHVGFIDTKANGKPKGTYANFCQMIETHNIRCRYNMMTKEVDVIVPGTQFITENTKNSSMAVLRSLAAAVEFPVDNIDQYVLLNSNENAYHPAIDWIESRQWDGVDRLRQLVSTLDVEREDLTEMLLRKWCLSAINHIYTPEGAKSSGILVLQGGQNLGKTRWLMNLVAGNKQLGKEGVLLNPTDRDSVKQAISNWIVELGELDATFRKADIAALKAFITRDHDEFRAPYARSESKYPRKTAFCASVNPREYLNDDENRRYWTIEVGPSMIPDHGIDMQQFWAQIKQYWIDGSDVTWLRPEEHRQVEEHNEIFVSVRYESELLSKFYDMNEPLDRKMTATEILTEIGIDAKEARKWSVPLQKFTGQKAKRSSRGNVYMMPNPINPFARS